MKLFEMFATLSLDTSEFESGATEAIAQSGEIEKAINSINTDSIDDEIAALDREIASLDKEIHSLEMANLDDDIAATDQEIKSLEMDLANTEKKSAIMQTAVSTAVSIGKELVVEALKFLWEFAGESLDYVAESGTEIGNQLSQVRSDFDINVSALKMKVGTALAPIAMGFYNLAEAMMGVTGAEKVNNVMSMLDSYTFDNLQTVQESLRYIFGVFEKWDPTKTEETLSFSDMTAGLESQIDYWTEYNQVMQSLQARGVDKNLLSMYADGSQESLAMLQALNSTSDVELQTIESTYAELETVRNEAAATINNAQLEVDASVDEMIGTIARLATDVSVDDAGENVFEVAQGMVDALASQYPNIAQWVNSINAKISTLGVAVHLSSFGERKGGGVGKSFAVGIDYVPANDYPAMLHEGEAVLTKAEATEWRRGASSGSADYSSMASVIASAVSDAISNIRIDMDGREVGNIVTDTVSRNIAREAWNERYST